VIPRVSLIVGGVDRAELRIRFEQVLTGDCVVRSDCPVDARDPYEGVRNIRRKIVDTLRIEEGTPRKLVVADDVQITIDIEMVKRAPEPPK